MKSRMKRRAGYIAHMVGNFQKKRLLERHTCRFGMLRRVLRK
jgi:hypothetical protein